MRNIAIAALSSIGLFLASALCLSQSAPDRQQKIESHNHKAAEYLKQNRPDLAAPEFQAVIALDPSNVEAHGNLGAILYFKGDYAGAAPQLRATLKLKPGLWKTQALLGMAERRIGDADAGMRDLEQAFPKMPEKDKQIKIDTGMELVEAYSRAGDLDQATAILNTLRKIDPTNEAVLYAGYRIYSDLAAESLISLSLIDPNSARMHQAMAHELAKRGDTPGAIENYRAALKLDPTLPGLHFELADMLSTQSTDEGRQEAEKEYKAALELNPLDEQSECRLGDIALQKDDLNEAAQRFTRALQLQPRDPEASIGMAKVLMDREQPQKAEELLHHALQLDPTSALAHYRLSTIYRQAGRVEDAKKELEQYEKFTKMKDQLRLAYHDLHQQHGVEENEAAAPKK